MVTGIVIPHETQLSLQKVEFRNLRDYQTAVGGYIETVKMDGHPLVIVADEDGNVKHLPVNRRATCLWWLLNPAGIGGAFLVGDVVILGAKRRGNITNLPANVIALLLESTKFQVKVLLSKGFDTWVPIGEPVDDFFEATSRALNLMQVWDPPSEVRVIAVD